MTAAGKFEILRAIRRAGTRGAVFQYRDVRNELGIDVDDKNEGARVFNHLKALLTDGIVEEVESERKRNRYYRVADDERLRQMCGLGSAALTGDSGKRPAPAAGTDRITRMEADMRELMQRIEVLESRLSEVAAILT